jgi:hypothetical protein
VILTQKVEEVYGIKELFRKLLNIMRILELRLLRIGAEGLKSQT